MEQDIGGSLETAEEQKVVMKEKNDDIEVKSEPESVGSDEKDDDDVRIVFVLPRYFMLTILAQHFPIRR